jgi:hypothetical protein
MKGCVVVGCGAVLLVVAAGIALVLFGARMTVRQETRPALHHPAPAVVGYEDVAQSTLALLERDPAGPRARYLAVEAAHVHRATTPGGTTVHAVPFAEELARLETELWARLARDVDPATLDVLRRGGFEYDVFPLGRGTYDLSYRDDGKHVEFSSSADGSSTSTRTDGGITLSRELARILGR